MSDWTQKHSLLSTKLRNVEGTRLPLTLKHELVQLLNIYLNHSLQGISRLCGPMELNHWKKGEKLKQRSVVWHLRGFLQASKLHKTPATSHKLNILSKYRKLLAWKMALLLKSVQMYQVLCEELVSRQFYWEPKSNQCQMPFTFGTPSNLVMPIKTVNRNP